MCAQVRFSDYDHAHPKQPPTSCNDMLTFMRREACTPDDESPVIARPQAVAIHEVLDCRVAALLAMTKSGNGSS